MTIGAALSNSLSALFCERKAEEPLLFPTAPTPAKDPVDCSIITLNREERVRKAFTEMPMTEGEARAVRALLDQPGATGPQLSRLCGWMDAAWMTQMLMLCQRRRRFLWPGGLGHDATHGFVLSALADYDAETSEVRPREDLSDILHAAVAAADISEIQAAG